MVREEEEKKTENNNNEEENSVRTVTTEQAPTRWKPNKNNGRGELKQNMNKIDNSLKISKYMYITIRIYK